MIQFRIQILSLNGKMSYLKDLSMINELFTEAEIRESWIAVIFNSVIIGEIDAGKLADESFGEKGEGGKEKWKEKWKGMKRKALLKRNCSA